MFGYHGDYAADWLGYAVDIELFFENIHDLEKAFKILHSLFNKFGLHINIKKTKTMIFNLKYVEKEFDSNYPESIVSLENVPIENVKTFRYLGDGVKFDEPSTGDAEIDLRINIAQGKFYETNKKLTNFEIHLSTRVMIFNSLARSRLTYSCQTWNVSEVQMQKINSAYVSMLRKLVRNGCKREEFRYTMTNAKILARCKTSDILSFVLKQQASYLGHLARQPITSLRKRLLFNDNKRTKSGCPFETLEDKVMKKLHVTKTCSTEKH